MGERTKIFVQGLPTQFLVSEWKEIVFYGKEEMCVRSIYQSLPQLRRTDSNSSNILKTSRT